MAPPGDESDAATLTDDVLVDNFDDGSINRGHEYADDDRVTLMRSRKGMLTSVVSGSGTNTYVTRLSWRTVGGDIVIDSTCTCPLGGYCKHAVASILVARAEAAQRDVDLGLTGNGRPWRQVIGGLDDADSATAPPAATPLALQFAVTHPKVTHYAPEPNPHLRIQPLRMGRRDKWVKTGASWRDLHYTSGYDQLDPGHVAALKGLWNASPRHSYYPDTGPITLDQFGPEMWLQLQNVVTSGVALVTATAEGTVRLADDEAHVEVDLRSDATGNLTVTSRVWAGDRLRAADDAHVGFLGARPHGVFVVHDDGDIDLFRLDRTIDPAMQRMLTGPPLMVPADDVDEFLDVYQPRLSQRARVASSDDSVQITERHFAGLALLVERQAIDVASLTWQVRYVRGEVTQTFGYRAVEGLPRDWTAETAAATALDVPARFAELLLGSGGALRDTTVRGVDAITLLSEVVPWLADDTPVAVTVTDIGDTALPKLREASGDPLVELAVSDPEVASEQTDWFDLAVNVTVDGETVPFAGLFTALSRDEPVLVLTSGTWLRLDRPEFERLRALIEEARGLVEAEADDDTIRINRFQVSWFDDLAALGIVTAQSDRWARNVARMSALAAPEPVDPPATLKAELRPYQADGLAWLTFIRDHELGGILADDMGLGKTVQILGLCASVLETDPDARFLVVAPTSVVENWQREAQRFVPSMAVTTITETAKRRGTTVAEAIADASLVVTSYTLFRLEEDDYALTEWDLLLLDEAQFVKNHTGKTYRAVRTLPARTKFAITGTPLENSLMDLWSLLSIVAPGLYPDPQRFSRVYRKPIEKGEAPELLATLRHRIAPLMRRRTKQEVLTDLPPKIEQVVEVELGAKHRRIYQTRLQRERAKVLGLVDDVQRNRFVIFKSLTLLRQLSLDPGLVDEADDHVGSAKLDRLVEDLEQIVAEGHRALVFSQFTRYLRRAEQRLGEAGIATVYLDGRTRRRAEVIDAFKSGDVPVFLISLKAGGVGLNLTEADYCFILDPWWNPATETQAVDRSHRIGQVNPVVVYRYVAKDTIEEKVMELKARKAALFADVVDADGALSGALSAEDIRGLFEAG